MFSKGPRSVYRLFRDRRLLLSSCLFDIEYYHNHYPDVAVAGLDPALHYLMHGAKERRNPSNLFNTNDYLRKNLDVAESGLNPLVHYILFGAKEGRTCDSDVMGVGSRNSGLVIADRNGQITNSRNSTNSYLTKSILIMGDMIKTILHLFRNTPRIMALKGGFWRTFATVLRVYRREGFSGIKARIPEFQMAYQPNLFTIRTPLNSTVSTLKNLEIGQLPIPEDATISVIIPTLNASKYFPILLPALRNQKGLKYLEIVVVDSGSTDNTLEIAKEYATKIVEIPPEKFSHSYSRNIGAEKATGNYLFFTVQDALPPSEFFLSECLSIFKNNDIVAVSCAEFPREDADLFYRVACWNHYEFLGVNGCNRILSKPDIENHLTLRQNGQLSDIACLIKKEIFKKYTYRYDYAEDLDLGIRLIRDGYKIAFLGSLKIIHSHNRPPSYYLKRGYADQIFLTKIFFDYPRTSIRTELLASEIILAYRALNNLVVTELDYITVPCHTKEFVAKISESFASIFKEGNSVNASVISPYIDEEFNTFLNEVQIHTYSLNGSEDKHHLYLLHAIVDFLRAASFPYLVNTIEVIDEQINQEFKTHLYKVFALLCGVNIANSYIAFSDNFDDIFGEIRAKLIGGV